MLRLLLCVVLLHDVRANEVTPPDYEYSSLANGWLKLHTVPATWQHAFLTCHYEGGVLASPLNEDIVKEMRRITRLTEGFDRPVYLGLSSWRYEGDYISLEGVPLYKMPIRWGSYGDGERPGHCMTWTANDNKVYSSSCEQYLPYICYKEKKEDDVLNACGTFGTDYEYNCNTGSCYKLHRKPRTWKNAQRVCVAEGGHLAVLNNKQEADFVLDLFLKDTPTNLSLSAKWTPHTGVHIGLLDLNKDFTWITVNGEKIEDVYNNWPKGQPDNKGINVCGFLMRDGSLEDHWCTLELKFVCEKSPRYSRFGLYGVDYADKGQNLYQSKN